MLKRDIMYTDFNGENCVETFYFNLTANEIMDLNFDHEGGLEAFAKKVIETEDIKSMFGEFKKIILSAYGVKSDDGKRFIKSDDLRDQFAQTAAYDALFLDLATNVDSLTSFIKGILPASLQREIEKAETTEVVNLPPLPPTEG